MATINAGSLYYAVDIDRASLQRAAALVRALGDSISGANKPAQEGNGVLRGMARSAGVLANKVTQLKADMDSNKISNDEMVAGLREVQGSARTLRGELETTGAATVENANDASVLQSVLTRLASVMKQTSQATGQSEGEVDQLGEAFSRLTNDVGRIGNKIRTLNKNFDGSNVDRYTKEMNQLLRANRDLEEQLKQTTGAMKLNNKQGLKVSSVYSKIATNTKTANTGLTKATGKYQSMAMAQKLSYGASTLLNDKIFQMSPALGILTNQLIFTTQGMRAFLRSALPIVAVAGTIIGLLGGLVVSLKSGAGLESALADVRKTTNLTTRELRDLTDVFQELSTEIPMLTTEMLDIAQVAGQLGIRGVDNIAKFTETIAKLSIATDVVGEEGATSLARFLQATGVGMDEMGSTAEQVANILNQLENTMAATASEILQMTSYTQGLSSQAGLTQDEILALNAALLSLGVKAEAGGSAVVRTMSKIQVAASQGGSELAAFAQQSNMTVDEFQALAREAPLEALLALTEGMNDSAAAGGDLNDILIDLGINEVRERRALLALAQGYDTLEEAVYEARKESLLMDSLNKEVAIQADTLKSKLTMLGSEFRTMAQDIGGTVVPVAKGFVDTLIAMVGLLDDAAVAVGLFAVSLGVGALVGALSKATFALGSATGFLGALKAVQVAVTAFLAGPFAIPLLIATLGTLTYTIGTSLYKASQNATTKTEELRGSLAQMEEDTEGLLEVFGRVRSERDLEIAIEAASETLTGEASVAWDSYKGKIQESIDKGEELKTVVEEAGSALIDIQLLEVGTYLGGAVDELGDSFVALQEEIGNYNALPLEFLQPLDQPDVGIDVLKNALTQAQEMYGLAKDMNINPEREDELEGFIEDLEAVIALREQELWLEQRLANVLEGEAGDTTPPPPPDGGGTTAQDPIQAILDQYEHDTSYFDRLHEMGRMGGKEYAEALVDAAGGAYDALIRLSADPNVAEDVLERIGSVIVDVGDDLAELEARLREIMRQEAPEWEGINLDEQLAATAELERIEAARLAWHVQQNEELRKAGELTERELEIRKQVMDAAFRRSVQGGPRQEAGFGATETEEALAAADAARELNDEHQRGIGISVANAEATERLAERRRELGESTRTSLAAERERTLVQQAQAAASERAVEEIRRQNAVLDQLAASMPTAEQQAYTEAMRAHNEEARRLDRLVRLGLMPAEQALDSQMTSLKSVVELAADAFGEQSDTVQMLLGWLDKLDEKLNGVSDSLSASEQATLDASTAAYEMSQRVQDATNALGEGMSGFSLGTDFEGIMDSAERFIEITENALANVEPGDTLTPKLKEAADALGDVKEGLEKLKEAERISGVFSGLADSTDGLVSTILDLGSIATESIASIGAGFAILGSEAELSAEDTNAAKGMIVKGVGDIAGGLANLLPVQDSVTNQMVEGFFAVGGAIVEAIVPIPGLGKAIAAAGKLISRVLGDLANGAKQVTEAMDEAAGQARLLSRETVAAFRDMDDMVERVSRGGLSKIWGGKKDQLNQELFDMVMAIAEGAASAFDSAFGGALDALMSGDADWKKSFKDNLEKGLMQIIMDTFIKMTILGEEFQDFIEGFTKALAEGGPKAAFEYMENELPGVLDDAEKDLDEFAEYVPDRFKIGTDEAVKATADNLDRIVENVKETTSYLGDELVAMLVKIATADGLVDQEALNAMVSLAETIAGGFESGLRQGINAFLSGDPEWKDKLRDGMTGAITTALINSFIASSAVQGIASKFIGEFVRIFQTEGAEAASDFAEQNVEDAVDQMAALVEAFVGAIPKELMPTSRTRRTTTRRTPTKSEPRAAGTNISEITGPTRDLLVDLLRPLSIMPSWTSWIRDIRNDVRAIASYGGIPAPSMAMVSAPVAQGPATVNIQSLTVNTQATDAKSLFRDISRYAFKERRGGK